jgi:hypothetical protein
MTRTPKQQIAEPVAHLCTVSCHAQSLRQPFPKLMPKKFRVISQAAPVAGKTKQDVHKALLKMNLKPEQIQLLLLKPLVIKKGLENAAALEYAERFSAAGLKVRIEAYEVAAPQQVSDEGKQRDQLYEALLKTFINPVQPADTTNQPAGTTNQPADTTKAGAAIRSTSLLGALPAPLIYTGLLLLWSFALLWYLGSGYHLMFGGLALPSMAGVLLWLAAWLVPALVGAGLLVCLLYPFWPRRIPVPHLRLDPKRHMRFHHLINQMTAAMDVMAPEFIEITPSAHVRVGPAQGIGNLGNGELRLTLGLAVVASCTVTQLLGLIAREFGRFSSPPATRAAICIPAVNGWFAHQSRIPSEWDERFQNWAEAYPAKPMRWAIGRIQQLTHMVRRLLGRLTAVNARATQGTLLQLEQDADTYQMRVSGTAEFAGMAAKQHSLLVAERETRQLNRLALYLRDQLLRDLPAAIDAVAAPSAPNPQENHQETLRLWEPHAPDATRIARANNTRTPRLISSGLPARILFDDFAQLCDSVTLHDYHRQAIADADHLRVDNAKILSERDVLLSQARISAIQQGERAPLNADGSVEWTAGRF